MQLRFIKNWKFLVLLLTAGSLSGCASMKHHAAACRESIKQYSIESYQGPFPLHDRRFVEFPP